MRAVAFLCFIFWGVSDTSPAPGARSRIPVELITLLGAGFTYILEQTMSRLSTLIRTFLFDRVKGLSCNTYSKASNLSNFYHSNDVIGQPKIVLTPKEKEKRMIKIRFYCSVLRFQRQSAVLVYRNIWSHFASLWLADTRVI